MAFAGRPPVNETLERPYELLRAQFDGGPGSDACVMADIIV
jgi:hypothetical protein